MHFIHHYHSTHWPRLFWLTVVNLIISVLAGLTMYQWQYNTYMRELGNEHAAVISNVNSAFSQAMGDVTNVARITNENLMHSLNVTKQDNPAEVFLSTGRALNNLSQIRWLSVDGQEKIRVNFLSSTSQIVPNSKLQNKASRYYYQQAMSSPQGMITLSPIDLNVENNEIVRPFQPTIRTIFRSFPSHPLGEGLLVLNFDLEGLLKQLQLFEKTHTDVLLASAKRQWLIHPEPGKKWAASLDPQKTHPLFENPTLVDKLFSRDTASLVIADNGAVYSAAKITLRMKHTHSMEPYTIVTRTPAYYYSYIINQSLLPGFITAFLIFCVVGILIRRDMHQQRELTTLNSQLAQEKEALQEAMNREPMQEEPLQSVMPHRVLSFFAGVNKEVTTSLIESQSIDWHQNDALLHYYFHQLNYTSSRLRAFANDLQKQNIDNFALKTLVDEVMTSLELITTSKNIELRENISEHIMLRSYPVLYTQLFELLLTSLIHQDFTTRSSRQIAISATTVNQRLRIVIKDKKNCHVERVKAALFTPFDTENIKPPVCGVGLYLARHWVVELHNGEIEITGEQDNGVQIIVTIPMHYS